MNTGKNRNSFGEEWAQHISEENYLKFIPIGLYGDSARVRTTFGSENVISVYCNLVLWRPKSVRFSRFLVFTIPEERCTANTLTAALRRIVWSCNHACNGVFPTAGPSGQNLSGKDAQMQGLPLTKKVFSFKSLKFAEIGLGIRRSFDSTSVNGTVTKCALFVMHEGCLTSGKSATGTWRVTTIRTLT